MPFAVDATKPAPGPWRMPTSSEHRCRVYFRHPFRDCTTLCEVSPDLEERTDASMRVICAAPESLAACRAVAGSWLLRLLAPSAHRLARAAVRTADSGHARF